MIDKKTKYIGIVQIDFTPKFDVSIISFDIASALANAVHYINFDKSSWNLDDCIELTGGFIEKMFDLAVKNDSVLFKGLDEEYPKLRRI